MEAGVIRVLLVVLGELLVVVLEPLVELVLPGVLVLEPLLLTRFVNDAKRSMRP